MSDDYRTVLGPDQRGLEWRSTLTGSHFAWDDLDGWQVWQSIGGNIEWRPVRPGIVTGTVVARTAERFIPLDAS